MNWMRLSLAIVFLGLVESQAPADMPPTAPGQNEGIFSTQPWMTINDSIRTESEEGNRESIGDTEEETEHTTERQEPTSHTSSSGYTKTISHSAMPSATADSAEIGAYSEHDSALGISADSNDTDLHTSIRDSDGTTADDTITDVDEDCTTTLSDAEDGISTISVIPPHVDGTTSPAVTTNKGSNEVPYATTNSEEGKDTTSSDRSVSDKWPRTTMREEGTTDSMTTEAADNTTLPTKLQAHDHSGGVLIPTVVCLIVIGLLFFCGYVWFTKIRTRYGDRQLLINEDELSNTQFFDFPL